MAEIVRATRFSTLIETGELVQDIENLRADCESTPGAVASASGAIPRYFFSKFFQARRIPAMKLGPAIELDQPPVYRQYWPRTSIH